jgi:hypothetical protein
MAKGFNLTAEINLRGPSNIRQVVGNIRKQLGTINTNVNVKIDKNTAKQISVANKAFINFNKTLKQTQTLSNTTSASLSKLATSAQQLSTSLASAPQKINQVAQSANKIAKSNQQAAQQTQVLSSEFAEFGRQSALAVRRFAAFATVTGVIYKVSNAVTSATKDFLEFEKELIKVAQVSKISVGQLDFLTNNITRLSSGLGVASNDLIGVSRTLAQAGLSATDTSKALQALARSALAPTFDNMNRTVEGSIALMKQFGISANQLEGALGSINAVAGSFAVEAGDIITAISRAGGVFASASNGVSQGTDALNEFIAVFTSVRSTTRESAETIATGLRTIFTRIQRSDTIDSLKAFGVTLTDLEGKFVGPYKAIELLSKGLRTLDPRDLRFGRIVEELGGFRQIGKVIPLIQQFGTAQKALNVAQQGSGSLARDAAVAQQSLANQIAKVQEQFTALIRSIAGSDGFRDLTKGVLDIASALISVADAAKSALPALTAIFAIKGFQALTQFGGGFLGGIKKGGGSLNSGGYVRGYAKGGVVPGTGNTDTVPAMLTPGEFVIRKKAVADIGSEKLHSMNRYASGGVIKPNDSIGYVVAQQEVTPDTKSINKELTVGQLPKGVNFKGKKSLAPDDTFTIQADYRKLAVSSPKEAGFAGEQATSKALQSVDTFLNSGKGKTGFPKNPASNISGNKSAQEALNGYVFEEIVGKYIGEAERGKAPFDFINKSSLAGSLKNDPVPNYLDAARSYKSPEDMTTKILNANVEQGLGLTASGFQQTNDQAKKKKQAERVVKQKTVEKARGGSVQDTVPAMLTPGEFVINKKSAQKLGAAKLHSLNKADKVKGYNKGGFVQYFKNGGKVEGLDDSVNAALSRKDIALTNSVLAKLPGSIMSLVNATDTFGTAILSSDPKTAAAQVKAYTRAMSKGKTQSEALTAAINSGIAETRKYSSSTSKVQKVLDAQAAGINSRSKSQGYSAGTADTRTSGSIVAGRAAAGGLSRSGDDMALLARESDAAAKKLQAYFKPQAAGQALTAFQATLIKTGSTSRAMASAMAQGTKATKLLPPATFSLINSFKNLNTSMPTFNKAIQAATGAFQRAKTYIGKLSANPMVKNMSKFGTILAFAGPMLADRVGDMIGGEKGAGIAGGASGATSALAVGSMLGPVGAVAGALAAIPLAFDGYNKGVAKKKIELENIKLDKFAKAVESAMNALNKNANDASAGRTVSQNIQNTQKSADKKAGAERDKAGSGLFSAIGEYFSLGMIGQEYNTDTRSGDEQAAARSNRFAGAAQQSQAYIDQQIEATGSLANVEKSQNAIGKTTDDLVRTITKANPAYQAEVQAILEANMAEELKAKKIDKLTAKYDKETVDKNKQAVRDKALQAASAKLSKGMTVVSSSLQRTMNNYQESLARGSAQIDKANAAIQKIATGATGYTVSLKSSEVLKSPNQFSREEQNAAIKQTSSFAGEDAGFMQQAARFSLDADDIISKAGVAAQKDPSKRGTVAQDAINQLTKRLEATMGRNQMTDDIRKELQEGLKSQQGKDGQGEVDLQKLIDGSSIGKALDFSKSSLDSLIAGAEALRNALQLAANGADLYAKQQQKIVANQARYQQTILKSDMALKQALGKDVGVGEKISARMQVASTTAGVESPSQLGGDFLLKKEESLKLEVAQINQSLDNLANNTDATNTKANKSYMSLVKRLGETESQLGRTSSAIQNLPSIIEGNINDVIGEIGRISQIEAQQKQAQADFATKLVTSTPEELGEINKSSKILNNALAGNVRTIQQSNAAQKAYHQTIRNGGTVQEANSSAQKAFAQETGSALDMFNNMVSMSGASGDDINSTRADLLETFAKGQGQGVENTPMFKQILKNLREPSGESKQLTVLKDIYNELKTKLISATGNANQSIENKQDDILNKSETEFLSALNNITLNFNQSQLDQMKNLGIEPPRTSTKTTQLKSKGGPIYANKGTYVDYQPRGTDTVPAMLTPGEFVVNRQATQKNRGLLEAINNSGKKSRAYSRGGVIYAEGGVVLDDAILNGNVDFNKPMMDYSQIANDGSVKPAKPRAFDINAYEAPDGSQAGIKVGKGGKSLTTNAQIEKELQSEFTEKSTGEAAEGAVKKNKGIIQKTKDFLNPRNSPIVQRSKKPLGKFVKEKVLKDIDGGSLKSVKGGTGLVATIAANVGGQYIAKHLGADQTTAENVGNATGMASEIALNHISGASAKARALGTTGNVASAAKGLAINAGIDIARTGYELVKDPGKFHQKKMQDATYVDADGVTVGNVVKGGLAGLARPADTIAQFGYSTVGMISDRAAAAQNEEKTVSMQQKSVASAGRNPYLAGLGPRAATYVNMASDLQIRRERKEIDEANYFDQKSKLPKITADDLAKTVIDPSWWTGSGSIQKQVNTILAGRVEIATDTKRSRARIQDERRASSAEQIKTDHDNLRREIGIYDDPDYYDLIKMAAKEPGIGWNDPPTRDQLNWISDTHYQAEGIREEDKRKKHIETTKRLGLPMGADQDDIARAEFRVQQGQETEAARGARNKTGFYPLEQVNRHKRVTGFTNPQFLPPGALEAEVGTELGQRQGLTRQIDKKMASKPGIFGDGDGMSSSDKLGFENQKNAELRSLHAKRDGINKKIESKLTSSKLDDKETRDSMWKSHNRGEVLQDRRDQRKAEHDAKKKRAEQGKSKAEATIAAAKWTGLISSVNPDKLRFTRPDQLKAFRQNVINRVRNEFGIERDKPDSEVSRILKKVGVNSDLVDKLMKPYSSTDIANVYESMVMQGGFRSTKASQYAAAFARAQRAGGIANTSPEDQEILKNADPKLKKEVGKKFQATISKNMTVLERVNRTLISKGLIKNKTESDPGGTNGAQGALDAPDMSMRAAVERAKIVQNLVTSGVVGPNDSASAKAIRGYGYGPLATFLYPNVQAEPTNKAMDINTEGNKNKEEKTKTTDPVTTEKLSPSFINSSYNTPPHSAKNIQATKPTSLDDYRKNGPNFVGPLNRQKGGPIYASTGMMVPYEPRGTDTVPAMLTPGEFVINRKATSQNRSLLESINSGRAYSKGGVVYAADGGEMPEQGTLAFQGALQAKAKMDQVPIRTAFEALKYYGDKYMSSPLKGLMEVERAEARAEAETGVVGKRKPGATPDNIERDGPPKSAGDDNTYDLTNPSDRQAVGGDAYKTLEPHVSNKENLAKLVSVGMRNTHLEQNADKLKRKGRAAEAMTNTYTGATRITVPQAKVSKATMSHEFGHALQGQIPGGNKKVGGGSAVQSWMDSYTGKLNAGELKDDHMTPGEGGIGYYSKEQMLRMQQEIFATLVQLKNQDPSNFGKTGGGAALTEVMRAYGFNRGGAVHFRPQGTDTVPAMLTPGEFVVNKDAAQKNLTSLQAMNQGGRVSYLAGGTPGVGGLLELDNAVKPLISAFQMLTQNMGQNAPANTPAGGVSSNSLDTSGLQSFTDTFGNLISQLNNIALPQIPSVISLQMAPASLQVDITGAEALGALTPDLEKLAERIVSRELNRFQQDNIEN